MAKGKPAPEKSKIARDRPLAYSRRQKGGGDGDAAGEATKDDEAKADVSATEAKADAAVADAKEGATPAEPPAAPVAAEAKPAEEPAAEAAAVEPPPPKGEPWPDATPQPMRPVEAPARGRTETISMPPELIVGGPPAMPSAKLGSVEDPTNMPGPRDIPAGSPGDPAAPPGRVPSGDSRSLRKDKEFALVYRMQTAVISRAGTVGTRGVWRVVEYPTSASASNAYAKEVSRFVAEGFSDYRD